LVLAWSKLQLMVGVRYGLRNALEYGLNDTAAFFREISPKIPHHLRKIQPQYETDGARFPLGSAL
jgi:hypothetical protein